MESYIAPSTTNESHSSPSLPNEWSSKTDEWGADDWKDGDGWETGAKKEDDPKEKRKQEFLRKREEKKLQRELANKEKKVKSAGAMKLGAVIKKNPKGDG